MRGVSVGKAIYKVKLVHISTNDSETETRSDEYIWYDEKNARDFLEDKRTEMHSCKESVPTHVLVDDENEIFAVYEKKYKYFSTTFRIEHVVLEEIPV